MTFSVISIAIVFMSNTITIAIRSATSLRPIPIVLTFTLILNSALIECIVCATGTSFGIDLQADESRLLDLYRMCKHVGYCLV